MWALAGCRSRHAGQYRAEDKELVSSEGSASLQKRSIAPPYPCDRFRNLMSETITMQTLCI